MRKTPPADEATSDPVTAGTVDLEAAKDDPLRLAAVAETAPWPTRGTALQRLRDLGAAARPAASKLESLLRGAVAQADWGDTDLLIESLKAIEPARLRPAVTDLSRLLRSDDPLAVRLACHALALIGPDAAEATPDLARRLADRTAPAAPIAARALARIGPGAASAVPALFDCLPIERPMETHETALAVTFDGYARLDTRETSGLRDADKAFAARDYALARTGYEAFRKNFPDSTAVRYASNRVGKCEALLRAAAEATCDGPANPAPDALAYHALNALFWIGDFPTNRLPRLIDLAMRHPWVGRSHGLESDVLPRYNSYGVLLLSRVAPRQAPLLLAVARRLADEGHFAAVADVVQAACLVDPGAKAEGLKVIAYATGPRPGGRQPWMGGGGSGERLTYVKRDLEGTFDMTDPRGIYKSRKEAAEKAVREKKGIPKVEEIVPDL
jgi:hypothetical protein